MTKQILTADARSDLERGVDGAGRRSRKHRNGVLATNEVLGRLIATEDFADAVSGADLFILALTVARAASLDAESAIDALVEAGLPEPRTRDRERLSKRVAQCVRDRPSVFFTLRGRTRVHCEDCREELLNELLSRPLVSASLERAKHARIDVGRAAKLAPTPRLSSATSVTPTATEPPASRSAPPAEPPPVVHGKLDPCVLGAIARTAVASLLDVSLAVRAHDLAVAEAFEELLAPASLVGVTSHAYQLETARRVLRVLRGRALLADEVGLGKTVEAMLILREYQLRGMASRVLVICPAALVHQWIGELSAKAGIDATTLDVPRFASEPDRFFAEPGVFVASLAKARAAKNAPLLQAVTWDLVIVDEAHHVKNRVSLGYRLVDGLRSRFLLLLTATPVETDLEEIYNLIMLLRPGQFATPAEFRRQFVDRRDPTSPRNRERLRSLLGEVMVRNTRARSGLALPPRFVTTVCVEPSPTERALYDACRELLRRHASDGRLRVAARALLLEAGSSVAAAKATLVRIASSDEEKYDDRFREGAARALALADDALAESSKGARLVDILREGDGFGLVFSRFRATQEGLAALLTRAGVRFEHFHGGLRAAEKQQALARFERDRCVLLATDVGGEGQNLQFCDLLVNYDLPWNPMLIEQRIGRLHRMGQKNEVRVFNLCAAGTAEQRLLDVLDRRLDLFRLVVGEMDMVLGEIEGEDLEDRILSLYAAAANDVDLDRGFDAIAGELLAARTRYASAKALDEALFGEDFEA